MKYSYRINGYVKNPFSNFEVLALVERKNLISFSKITPVYSTEMVVSFYEEEHVQSLQGTLR